MGASVGQTSGPDPSSAREKRDGLPTQFKVVLAGESLSLLGAQISTVMIPLIAVLALHADELILGILSAISWFPIVIFGLFAGTIIDRSSRWLIMAICNIVRAALISVIPILAVSNTLNLSALLLVAFGVGICNVFFDIAYQTYVPELVAADALGKANSGLEFFRSAAQLIGPLMGGLLATIYRPEFVVSITSITFLIAFSALLVLPSRFRVRPVNSDSMIGHKRISFITDLRTGLSLVWKSSQIRLVVLAGAMVNIFAAGVSALFVLFVTRSLGLDSSVFGITVAVAGIGALVGALTFRCWANFFHEGTCVAVGLLSTGLGTVLVALAVFSNRPMVCLTVGQLFVGYGSPVMNISLVTLRQRLTPLALLGRVNASARVAIMSSLPLGALLVSGLAEATSTTTAIWVSAVGELAVLLILGPFLLRIKANEPTS